MKHLVFLFLLCYIAACGVFQNGPRQVSYTRVDSGTDSVTRFVNVYIYKSFTNEDRLHIQDAFTVWNYALNTYIKYEVKTYDFESGSTVEHPALVITPVYSKSSKSIPKLTDPNKVVLAWADTATREAIYIVRDRVTTQEIFGLMLHEIGHILGADHTTEASLMYAIYTAPMYACIDETTITQVAIFNYLPLKNLNYCE